MEQRPDLGLDSYDRLIPNQDTLPQGGLGNLIALPLRKQPRGQANSVFLDDNLSPYPDQWDLYRQHPADPLPYRRDQHKDRLLQENGSFVLRYLAEDVGKNFAEVLNAILRVLANRGRRQGVNDLIF